MGNKKKAEQLRMSFGAASNRLRKKILFSLIQEISKDACFQCGEKIETIDDFSIEHKVPWLDSDDPIGLYFDLSNIAFSHMKCNVGAARKSTKGQMADHGTTSRYQYGCRCNLCRGAKAIYDKEYGHRDRQK